jgi:nucleoside-diphosphate-sugar epimerase
MDAIKISTQRHAIVSGGAGFIGSHLARRLLKENVKVTILTRNIRSPRAMELSREGADIVQCDFATPGGVERACDLKSANVLYHLAADLSVSSPLLQAINVEGTRRALDLVASLDIPYVVYASSIEAQGLGSTDEIPLSEDHPCRPVSDYGASKRDAEQVVLEWARTTSRQALILRIGNVYGPGSAWLLQPSLMALAGLLSLSGAWAALQHRLFQPLYIDDAVDGMLNAASQRLVGLYNLVGEETIPVQGYLQTLAALVQMPERLSQITSESPSPKPGQRFADDFAYLLMGTSERCHRVYDNGKLRNAIASYARWPLVRGLSSTLQWYYTSDHWSALLRLAQAKKGTTVCMSH